MSQPIWEFVTNLGDADPIEHGGLFLYKDTSGVYGFEMERLERLCDDDSEDDDDARWEVRRVCLDRCKVIRVENSLYLCSFTESEERHHEEWFAKDLSGVASTMGTTREELEQALCSEDGINRAWAYRAIADFHGWDNFDSYPLTLTREEVEDRYMAGEVGHIIPDNAVSLKSEHVRNGLYSSRKVHCPNAGPYGAKVSPGDLITFAYPSGGKELARVLARVDAPAEGRHPDAEPCTKAVVGHLAVLMLGSGMSHAYVRWINPEWVTSCGSVPKDFIAFFFADKLPGVAAILKLDSLGSLDNSYIAKYNVACEACIVEYGMNTSKKPCTHGDFDSSAQNKLE